MKTFRLVTLPVLLLAACADGGEEDRPASEIAFTATHHLYGLRTLRGFGEFPIVSSVSSTDRAVLNLFDNSSYTVTRASGTSPADRYALEADGTFSVYVEGYGQEPSQVFLGGYGQVGEGTAAHAPDFFFTDRVSSQGSPRIGLYYGTRILNGQVELEGNWHLLSLHVVFGQSLLAPENVGRAARGSVQVAAGAPGTVRAISGTGSQGTSGLTFGGSIQNLLDNSDQGDGTCNLTLDYTLTGLAADVRNVQAAANDRLVFGVDEDSGDGEAGLVMMVRKFDTPAAPVDSVRVPGTFLVGGHTLFVNPSNSGSDTFVGIVELTPQAGFRLDGVDNTGGDFSYTGTYSLNADGGMVLNINGTNETWFAAIDRSYNTLVFVDDFEELRPNNTPELNFGFGVRRADP